MARVLYLNVHDMDYPRNRRIRSFLGQNGHDVTVVKRPKKSNFVLDFWRVMLLGFRAGVGFDYVVLSEFSIQFAMAAKLVAIRNRAFLITDAFVGLYETNVLDWEQTSSRSVKAKAFLVLDWLALKLSSLCLIDTKIRAERLRVGGAANVLSLPVGAPDWARWTENTGSSRQLKVLYYGNYIALHGLDYLLKVITDLPNKQDFLFTFLGNGTDRPRIEAECSKLGLMDVVRFRDSVPEVDLAGIIREHSVVLGIFGTSAKAESVIANKVWQGLASGKTVLTRDSVALLELGPLVGEQLITIDVSQESSLRDSLAALQEGGASEYPETAGRLQNYVNKQYADLADALRGPMDG